MSTNEETIDVNNNNMAHNGDKSVGKNAVADEEAMRFDQRISESRHSSKDNASVEDRDAAAEDAARYAHSSGPPRPGAYQETGNCANNLNDVSAGSCQQSTQTEQDIATKQQGQSTNSVSSRPRAHSVSSSSFGRSRLEQDNMIDKQQAGNHLSSVPGAHQVASDQLTQLDRDVAAKSRAHPTSTGESIPGGFLSSQPGAPSLGNGALDTLETDLIAKSRARPSGHSIPSAYNTGSDDTGSKYQGLTQMEQDITTKQQGQSTSAVNSRPGAHSVSTSTSSELSHLEQDMIAKQQAGNHLLLSASSSVPGAHQVASDQLTQFYQDVAVKSRARPTSIDGSIPGAFSSSQPGAPSSGNGALDTLETDLIAKNRSHPSTQSIPGAHSEQSSPTMNRLEQLEDDVAAKNRATSIGGAAVPGMQAIGTTNLSQLEQDVAAKNMARPIGGAALPGAQLEGMGPLGQLESDVAAKSSYPPSGQAFPGAYSEGPLLAMNHLSQLEHEVESEALAKERARLELQGVPSTGIGHLDTLEQDVAAKNRGTGTSPITAQPGAHPAFTPLATGNKLSALESDLMIKSQNQSAGTAATHGLGSGNIPSLEQDVLAPTNDGREACGLMADARHLELSNPEQNEVTKNRDRARPASLMSSGNEMYTLENSFSEKPLHRQSEPREESLLFTNVGHNSASNDRFVSEMSCLGEPIAQKSGLVEQPQPDVDSCCNDRGHHNVSGYGNVCDGGHGNRYGQRVGGGGSGALDSYSAKPSGKNDVYEDELLGVEQACDDKDFLETRPMGDEGGISLAPIGDMEYGNMGLAVATPIEEEEEDSYIPAAMQYDPDAKPPLYKNRRFRLYGFVGFCFVILAVVAAVVVTQVAGGNSKPGGPTIAPTSYRELLGIKEQITDVFGSRYFDDPESTQSKVLTWLINEDKFQIKTDAENLIQRFVLTHLYYETSQEGPWLSCNPPTGAQPDLCYYQFFTGLDRMKQPQFLETYWHRWLSNMHECEWAGIYCHSDKVTDISLDYYGLTGTFPKELSKLDYLRDISLTHNNFVGKLPTELAQMKHLTDIELQYNEFTGTIPVEWFGAKNLIHLNIGGNDLSGQIPSEFGLLTDLQRLFSQNNLLSGPLPMEIFELTSLRWIFISDNQFTGQIPTEIGQLTNLEYLHLNGNFFSGAIPTELGVLRDLAEIDIHDTNMEGTIPEIIFTSLGNRLDLFDASSCQFSGTISTNIGLCGNLDWFLVSDNSFTGTIPTEAGLMTSLVRFQVEGNDLSGSVPNEMCLLRGDTRLRDISADCSTISTGETPVFCPAGCCSECCNQDTGICLPTVG